MAEKLSKEWFELRDVRNHNFSQDDWIPVYWEKKDIGSWELPLEGYSESISLRSFAVFSGKDEEYKNRVSRDMPTEFSVLNSVNWNYPEFDAALEYRGRVFTREGLKFGDRIPDPLPGLVSSDNIGFHIFGLCPRADRQQGFFINYDFIFAFGLVQKGRDWFAQKWNGISYILGKKSDQVIKVLNSPEKGNVVFIRKTYLEKYLEARNADLRLVYFNARFAYLKDKPEFLEALLSRKKEGEYNISCSQFNRTAFGKTEQGNSITARLWRSEWITKSGDFAYNTEKNLVWIKDGDKPAEQIELSNSYKGKSFICLAFRPDIVMQMLEKGEVIRWFDRNEGFLSISGIMGLPFGVDSQGNVRVNFWNIARLSGWLKRNWAIHSVKPETPYEDYKIGDGRYAAGRYYGRYKMPPEIMLAEAMRKVSASFSSKFSGLGLYRDDRENIAAKLYRFYALDEEGLRNLAVKLNEYVIDRLDNSSLENAILRSNIELTDGQKKDLKKELNRYNHFTLLLKKLNVGSELQVLQGLKDLRNKVSHYDKNNIELAYKRIGINRNAPCIEQGAQLLEKIAIAFEQISRVLE